MARPIKDTPILTGNDAVRFLSMMENLIPETDERKIEMKKNFEEINKLFKQIDQTR